MSYYHNNPGGYSYYPQQPQQQPQSTYPPQQQTVPQSPVGTHPTHAAYGIGPQDYSPYQQPLAQAGYSPFQYGGNYSVHPQLQQAPSHPHYQQNPGYAPYQQPAMVSTQAPAENNILPQHPRMQPQLGGMIPSRPSQPSSQLAPNPQPSSKPQPAVNPQRTPQQLNQASQVPARTSSSTPKTQSHPKVVITGSPSMQKSQSPSVPTVDNQQVLLALAEEYIGAARGLGFIAATSHNEADVKRYYKLMATGIGCIEALLKSFKLQPRQEAILRLRYASLLFSETDNYRVAEEALSKGVTLCQRYRLLDLQYSMQHLQARMLLETNTRAALRAIDGPLAEAEASQHIPWVYAFRFLKVSTHLAIGTHSENAAAIQVLHSLSNLAKKRRDVSMFIASTTFEALLHLRNPSDDSIQQAQQAIASARTFQLGDQAKELGPLFTLLDMIDLACSLQCNIGREASRKMAVMQRTIDEKAAPLDPNGSGSFGVQLDRTTGGELTLNTGGVFEKSSEGRDRLCFSWLNQRDIYILAHFLCGAGSFLPPPVDTKSKPQTQSAEQHLEKALSYVHEALKPGNASQGTLAEAFNRQKWLSSMKWMIRLLLTFVACGKKDWSAASGYVQSLRKSAASVSAVSSEARTQLTTYLDGVIKQGEGDLYGALAAFQSPELSIPEDSGARGPNIATDLRILAALNSILILRDPSHPQHFLCDVLISTIGPLCMKSPNKNIHAAFNLIQSAANSTQSIIKRKQDLSNAINNAKETNNHQILCICLTMMSEAFFKDSIGEQAEKSALSACNMAQRWGDPMWICITFSLCSATFERQGKMEEAARKMAVAYNRRDLLPDPLKQNLE